MNYVGKFLTASPMIKDDQLDKSVVFVYQQLRTNITGISINTPSTMLVSELCKHYDLEYTGNECLYIGGPDVPNALIMIHSDDWMCENTMKLENGVCISSYKDMLSRIASGDKPLRWKLVRGMHTWKKSELDNHNNPWYVGASSKNMIFQKKTHRCWEKALTICSKEITEKLFKL